MNWMKLDNAATIYPLVESDYNTTVFRFSATLNIKVNQETLLEALQTVIKRFPYYQVTLKSGFFWYYLEENHNKLDVYEDKYGVCKRINKVETNGYLFRVLYIDHKISLEMNHILGDGTAGLTFLNTIVHEYLRLVGIEVGFNEWVKDPNSEIDDKEFEDSHNAIGKKYLKTHNKKIDNIKGVFHLKNRLLKKRQYIITHGIIDAKQLSVVAKNYQASVTVFLASLYLMTMIEIQNEQVRKITRRRPVAIQIPVNMRKRLDSKSMRNFSLFITPYLLPNQSYTLEDIIEHMRKEFDTKITLDYLLTLMVQNLKTANTPFVRLLPLRLKNIITPLIYKAVGVDTYSGTISNIGRITLPEGMEENVTRIDFILGPCPLSKTNSTVVGYQEKLFIAFGRNIKDAIVERNFFRHLVELGINVEIETIGGENK